MSRPASCPEPGEVRAWYGDAHAFTADGTRVARWLDALDPIERERHGRYRRPVDRAMFLMGRAMARTLVGRALGVGPDGWAWTEGPRGRPQIGAPATPLRFNLAHSAGLVVCGLAYGRDVGVDVEDLERRQTDPALVRRYCSPAEAEDILIRGARWADRFLDYWTLKEAYLKARGLGIAVPLADLSFRLGSDRIEVAFLGQLAGTDDRWRFALTRPTGRHVVAVAADAADGLRPEVRLDPIAADEL